MQNIQKNIIFIFADQWRGTADTQQCHTPSLDQFKQAGIDCTHAISGCSQCSPYRASLLTGLYPLRHGVLVNDATLSPQHASIAQVFKTHGYKTAYIGKWHVHGSPTGGFARRNAPIPEIHRLGFDHWQGNECNHDYNNSPYFLNNDSTQHIWEGYDALAQTRKARKLIKRFSNNHRPFLLMLSWGPPHDPYHTAPDNFKALYNNKTIEVPENVPAQHQQKASEQLRGYYAHISALDECLRMLLQCLKRNQLDHNTLVIFTSDHGDMIFSHGLTRKLFPFEESIRIPLIIRDPHLDHQAGTSCPAPIDAPDLMPTLLGLTNLPKHPKLQGRNWAPVLRGEQNLADTDVGLLSAPVCSGPLQLYGLKAYRGIRTLQHTYVRNEDGPWLLFDNLNDPFQKNNLVRTQQARSLAKNLDEILDHKLRECGDTFQSSDELIDQHQLARHVANTGVGSKVAWHYPW